MDLVLWRHAQAQVEPVADDLARRLTTKGERQAERMAAWLNQRLPNTARILVSPAQRTQQTAQPLARAFKTMEALAPGVSVDDVLQAARWPDTKDTVLLVGHQPTLGMVAARLMTGQDLPWSIRKGAVWWLRGRELDGALVVTLQAVQSPDFL